MTNLSSININHRGYFSQAKVGVQKRKFKKVKCPLHYRGAIALSAFFPICILMSFSFCHSLWFFTWCSNFALKFWLNRDRVLKDLFRGSAFIIIFFRTRTWDIWLWMKQFHHYTTICIGALHEAIPPLHCNPYYALQLRSKEELLLLTIEY